MKKLLLAAAATVALGGAAVLAADTAAPEHQRPMRLMQYDLNNDGSVTRAEVDEGVAASFKTADTNGNGSLDEAELKAYHEARKAEFKAKREAAGDKPDGDRPHDGRGQRGDMFKQLDWNLDGALSLDEFAVRPRMMVAHADADGDGTVTKEESQARRHWRHGDKDGDKDKGGETAPDQKN